MPECPGCGMAVSEEALFCPSCGTNLESNTTATPRQTDSGSETTRHSMFYIGAILAVFGVVFLPFVFFLIALPEAIIYAINGGSVLDSLSADARDNPAMRGSFLIFRWFGNFLLLVFVLAVVLGILIAL